MAQRVAGDTTIDELAASALRNAVRYQHAECGPYAEWRRSLLQPAATYDPRDPARPRLKGHVRVTLEVVMAWEDLPAP